MQAAEHLDQLLRRLVEQGASDLHLSCGAPPCLRIHGELRRLDDVALAPDSIHGMLQHICSPSQWQEFAERRTVDIGYGTPDGERFRINAYCELGRPALAARHLDQRMLSLQELRLPPALGALASLRAGLVLVTGTTGSGKSTTLAALIDQINRSRACHILTIEDPVEFVHPPKRALVHHRELYADVPSFAEAVRAALREDPDVILVGEMRDIETMRAALTAAETGHLVFSTLHTGEAIGCIERLVGSFPGDEQEVARHRIGMALRAVIAQQLIPVGDDRGRVPAIEILMVNPAVANLIASSKTRQIFSVMETGSGEGMQTFDQSLSSLVRDRLLSSEEALAHCHDATAMAGLLNRNGRRNT
ncbi:MAG: PilT/PilU family type 4a pilus ATPase [Gammaproteobacteria bacterium]|nr:PilT/PilU family type 4a pilus ATPase [Gammaproteobacteria bacterium]